MPRTDGISGNARRKQKAYQDILGRTFKTETYNWNGTVYSTSLASFNERDQVLRSRQFEGDASSTTFQDTTATFDGHGRMATSHRPEQRDSSNNLKYTTYNYNADDSISSVTDGRGAVTNYTYENSGGTPLRPLLTGMSWSVPQGSGIPVPASVTMAYDNAGNRTQMTDGLGSVTYEYDDLSRMTSESRYFNDLPSAPVPNNRYTIGYSYGLSGNLTGYTDPFGESIDYAQDRRGRLASVTGSSFGGVSTYATNPGYRAWGGLKSLSYGNGMEMSVDYDDRLLPEQFRVVETAAPTNKKFDRSYEYYLDGRLKLADEESNTYNQRFDRSFTFDQLGRVIDAKSGIEAHGQTETDLVFLPYRQSYTYTALGGLAGRTSTLWDHEGNWDFAYTVTNNRTAGYGYDHDGRQISGDGIDFVYSASGGLSSTARTEAYELEIDRDGAGREGKRKQRTWDAVEEEWSEWKSTYLLYSSVLGRVVSEANNSGTKWRTLVIAGGAVIARQAVNDTNDEAVGFEHRDPLRLSTTSTTFGEPATGTHHAFVREEFDGLGNNIGHQAAFTPEERPENANSPNDNPTINDMDWGDCTLDGVIMPCSMVDRMREAIELEARYLHNRDGLIIDRFQFDRSLPGRHSLSIWVPNEAPRGELRGIYDDESQIPEFIPPRPSGSWFTFEVNSPDTACSRMVKTLADQVDAAVSAVGGASRFDQLDHGTLDQIVETLDHNFSKIWVGLPMNSMENVRKLAPGSVGGTGPTINARLGGQTGFKKKFWDGDAPDDPNYDQTHHFVAYFSGGINNMLLASFAHAVTDFRDRNTPDIDLGNAAYYLGFSLRTNTTGSIREGTRNNENAALRAQRIRSIASKVRREICD